MQKCKICGKALTDPLSIELALGPICRIELKMKEASNMNGNLFSHRADYSYSIENNVVCIVDNDNGKSVSNDIMNVMSDLLAKGVDVNIRAVIYRDTMGVWDEIVYRNGFYNFRSINERDKEIAKTKVLNNNTEN